MKRERLAFKWVVPNISNLIKNYYSYFPRLLPSEASLGQNYGNSKKLAFFQQWPPTVVSQQPRYDFTWSFLFEIACWTLWGGEIRTLLVSNALVPLRGIG